MVMTVIEQARELGKAIQTDERYIRYMKASEINDTDTEIQNRIGEFNLKRSELSEAMRTPDKDADKLTTLDKEIREMYDEIMAMPKMVEFNEAKAEMDKLLDSINFIVSMAANGEDPMTCPEQAPHGCSGSCSTCGGCH
jgi:cell fate (sporulation/competence/biofilm development) regulator YlbF (YheA/YmcA/DUF963 family)